MDKDHFIGITDQELQRARQWFASKGVTPKCPICNGGSFDTLRPIAAPVLDDTRSEAIPNKSWTLLPLACNNCAYILFFHADRTQIFWKPD